MSDLDAVLERLVTDPAFAHELSRNPTEALAGYELSSDELSTLSTQVSFDRGAGGPVEERISKSSMFGLLSSMAGGLSGFGDGTTGLGGPDTAPAGIIILDQPAPAIDDPNQTQGVIDPNQAPTEDVGIHEVDEKPTESVGIHEVDEQPAPDVGIVSPGDRVGFNPQPDPPGLRG